MTLFLRDAPGSAKGRIELVSAALGGRGTLVTIDLPVATS